MLLLWTVPALIALLSWQYTTCVINIWQEIRLMAVQDSKDQPQAQQHPPCDPRNTNAWPRTWNARQWRELEWTLGPPLKGGAHWKLREDWNLMHMSPTVFWMCELNLLQLHVCCFIHKITFITWFFQDSVNGTDLILTSLASEFSGTFRHSRMTLVTIMPRWRGSGSHWAKSKL